MNRQLNSNNGGLNRKMNRRKSSYDAPSMTICHNSNKINVSNKSGKFDPKEFLVHARRNSLKNTKERVLAHSIADHSFGQQPWAMSKGASDSDLKGIAHNSSVSQTFFSTMLTLS